MCFSFQPFQNGQALGTCKYTFQNDFVLSLVKGTSFSFRQVGQEYTQEGSGSFIQRCLEQAGKRRLKRRENQSQKGRMKGKIPVILGQLTKSGWGGQGERHCYRFDSSMSVSQSQIDVVLKIPLSFYSTISVVSGFRPPGRSYGSRYVWLTTMEQSHSKQNPFLRYVRQSGISHVIAPSPFLTMIHALLVP